MRGNPDCPKCGGHGIEEVLGRDNCVFEVECTWQQLDQERIDAEMFDPRNDFEDDGSEPGEECGRWINGSLTYSCRKAGSEECDFECPYRSTLKF